MVCADPQAAGGNTGVGSFYRRLDPMWFDTGRLDSRVLKPMSLISFIQPSQDLHLLSSAPLAVERVCSYTRYHKKVCLT